jgi:hypothetical protein
MRKLRWVAALLASMMILGACGGDESGASDTTAPGSEALDTEAPGEAAAPDQFGVTDEALTNQTVVDRKVIRTGQMEIQVTDTRAAMEEITRLVDRSGGYVSSSEVTPSGADEQPYVTLTIRIPAGDLDTALAAIRELSERVAYESIQSQDVTEEYVDIEARLRNLTALETELVALLAEVRAQADADPQKILTVFNEVSRVRGEIEVLEGRRRLIDNQASLSTITVTISPSPSSTPIVDEGWAPLVTVRNAAGDLVEALQTIANAGIWLVVFALPVLALIALPIWVGLRLLKRASRRRHTPVAAPPAELETVDQD